MTSRPRRIRGADLSPNDLPPRWAAPLPAERLPPFAVADGVLLTPFARRRGGLTPAEAAVVDRVFAHLACIGRQRGDFWINATDYSVTPAQFGAGWTRRRMADFAAFNLSF